MTLLIKSNSDFAKPGKVIITYNIVLIVREHNGGMF